jgi:hypothetical protein
MELPAVFRKRMWSGRSGLERPSRQCGNSVVSSQKKKKGNTQTIFPSPTFFEKKKERTPTHTRSSKYTHILRFPFSVFPLDMTSDWINKWHIHTVNVHSPPKKENRKRQNWESFARKNQK